jgi:hypothetical protein
MNKTMATFSPNSKTIWVNFGNFFMKEKNFTQKRPFGDVTPQHYFPTNHLELELRLIVSTCISYKLCRFYNFIKANMVKKS